MVREWLPKLPSGKLTEYSLYMQQWMFTDGSGKPRQDGYIAYCGYVATAEATQSLFDRWVDAMDGEQVSHVSMKELNRWEGIWEHKRRQWGDVADAKRREFLLLLADLIRDTRMFGFGWGVNASTFREKQIEPTEYYLFVRTLEMLLPAISHMAAVSIVVDEEESQAEQVYKFFRRVRKDKPHLASMIKLVGIGDDKAIPGLQAADLLAYAMVAELKRQERRPTDSPDELHERLVHGTDRKALTVEQLFADPNEFLKIAGIV